jgi:hypothetical protein
LGAAASCRHVYKARSSSAAAATPCCISPTRPAWTSELQRASLDSIKRLNQQRLDVVGDPEIATRINQLRWPRRMQTSAPELMDLSKEPKHSPRNVRRGAGQRSFANACLLARRLVERGVRFVEIFHEAWDQHGNLKKDIVQNCRTPTKPPPRWSKTSSNAACWTTPSSSGAANSGARRWSRARQRRPRSSSELRSRCGWRAAA